MKARATEGGREGGGGHRPRLVAAVTLGVAAARAALRRSLSAIARAPSGIPARVSKRIPSASIWGGAPDNRTDAEADAAAVLLPPTVMLRFRLSTTQIGRTKSQTTQKDGVTSSE